MIILPKQWGCFIPLEDYQEEIKKQLNGYE